MIIVVVIIAGVVVIGLIVRHLRKQKPYIPPDEGTEVPTPIPTATPEPLPIFYVYQDRTPVIYENDRAALVAGYPSVLHYDPDKTGQNKRRGAACSDSRKREAGIVPPQECDEYPFASTFEGGFYNDRFARIVGVASNEHRRQGGDINKLRLENRLTTGSPFFVVVVPAADS